jgi:hypothetical protein
VIHVSIVVYWMMILWLKEGDTCVNGGLLNDDIWIKTKVKPVSMVVYWMMIFGLKQSDTCVNGGFLNDDIWIKTKWYLEIKAKWHLC